MAARPSNAETQTTRASPQTLLDETKSDEELRTIFAQQCLVKLSRADLVALIETGKTADMKRTRKSIPQWLRIKVWYRWYGPLAFGACPCCGCEISILNCDCGHVVAASAGGMTCLTNLRPLCGGCNRAMGDQDFYEHLDTYVGVGAVAREPPVFPAREFAVAPDAGLRDIAAAKKQMPEKKARVVRAVAARVVRAAPARNACTTHDDYVHVERDVHVPQTMGFWARLLTRLR